MFFYGHCADRIRQQILHNVLAAKGGNWDFARYQLKEAMEIQEVGETTRSEKAAMFKNFEATYLEPLNATLNAEDWNAFQSAYNNTIDGCNGCHTLNKFPYIKYAFEKNYIS